MVIIVINATSNQLSIPYHAFHVWSTLKQKIRLAFNFAVHFYLWPLGLYSHLGEKFVQHFKTHKRAMGGQASTYDKVGDTLIGQDKE